MGSPFSFSSQKRCRKLRLNRAIFWRHVGKRIFCDHHSRHPFRVRGRFDAAFDKLHKLAVLKNLGSLPHHARNRQHEHFTNIRRHRIVVELHPKAARLKCRAQMQDQCMNEQFLLRCRRVAMQVHIWREHSRKFLSLIEPRPDLAMRIRQCEQVPNPSLFGVRSDRVRGRQETDKDACRLQKIEPMTSHPSEYFHIRIIPRARALS